MINFFVRLFLRSFSIFSPPQKPIIFSGIDSTLKLASLVVSSGYRRPLLVAGHFSLQNRVVDGTLAYFEQKRCEVTIFSGVIPNPTFQIVEAGVQICKKNDCDSVFVIGGSSAIDTAKVIAAASTNNRRLDKLVGILKANTSPLPMYVVPTTSGTGLEVTTADVISDTKTHQKKFFMDPKLIPIAVALDPIILSTLPPKITAATGMDALTHAIEVYTSRNHFKDIDRDAELAIKLLFEHLPTAFNDGNNLNAREMVSLASFLASYAFTKSSFGYVHAISHQVSAHYNTPHGLANAIILPRVLRFNQRVCAERFAKLESMLSESNDNKDIDLLAASFIERVDRLADRVEIPMNLPELNPHDYDKIIKGALSEVRFSYSAPKVMKKRDVNRVLESVADGSRVLSFD